ncbi:hypothetical protein ACFQH2_13035 [Natronoarchaeum sp. GCM10025703]|uniref:DUF7344 domain-containing protein n=1 Tax=unclassified Natronoarchaeum TaxID=2620183 RepID=UPI00361DA4CF
MSRLKRGSIDELYRIAADPTRRALVTALLRTEGTTTVDGLVEAIRDEIQPASERATSDHLAIELYHRHLPMLQAENCIEFDADLGVVRPLERLQQFEQLSLGDTN